MERFVSLYLPDWPIDRIRRKWPTARRRDPLVLTEWRGSAQMVAHASPEARAGGVCAGMTLSHAQALLAGAAFEVHDPLADAASLELLARWAVRFSPRVGVDPPHGLFLDVTGCERLFRGEGNLLSRLVGAIRRSGISVYGAIASTLGTAWAVSHASQELEYIVPADQSYAALSALPPWALRLDHSMASQLDALGIRRIETLLMLPRSTLPARFGESLLRRIDQALGHVSENFTPIAEMGDVSADICFDGAVGNYEVIQLAVEKLLDRVIAAMEKLCRGANRLDVLFYAETGVPNMQTVRLCMPSRNRRHLLNLLQAQCERIELREGIEAVRLMVSQSKPLMPEQGEFFESSMAGAHRDVAEVLDELASRLGGENVIQPELVESHRPERGWRAVRVQDGPQAKRKKPSKKQIDEAEPCTPNWDDPGMRPLRLLPKPCPIEVFAMVPDRPPSWFRYQGREYRSHGGVGPERINHEWWNQDRGTRDYYRIDTDNGSRFWVFCEAESRRWFLHGIFE